MRGLLLFSEDPTRHEFPFPLAGPTRQNFPLAGPWRARARARAGSGVKGTHQSQLLVRWGETRTPSAALGTVITSGTVTLPYLKPALSKARPHTIQDTTLTPNYTKTPATNPQTKACEASPRVEPTRP